MGGRSPPIKKSLHHYHYLFFEAWAQSALQKILTG